MSSRFILPFADVGDGISPSDGAQLFFFESGTSTPQNTFSDEGAINANTNPVIANAKGVFPDIWIVGNYKVRLKTKEPNAIQIWEADPVKEVVVPVVPASSLNRIIFLASGTYNPSAGIKTLGFMATAGGGGAGGTDGQGLGTAVLGIPGGGAGTVMLVTSNIESSYDIEVGSGGSGAAAGANTGTDGESSTITSTLVNILVRGGSRGFGTTGISGSDVIEPSSSILQSSGGEINLPRTPATIGSIINGSVASVCHPGASIWGSGPSTIGFLDGRNALAPGAGGGASMSFDTTGDTSGGDGGAGIVVIDEYF